MTEETTPVATQFDVRAVNLRALNSATKYPSIPTYHALDPKGGLLEQPAVFPGTVIATEKIDGTNSRIIATPDGSWLLGSREELLYARGDLIGNPALGIVEQLRPVAEELFGDRPNDGIWVYYLELYGGKIGGAARQYAKDPNRFGWRLFDVAHIPNWADVLGWPAERISSWRDSGGQQFVDEDHLHALNTAGFDLVPRLTLVAEDAMPTTVADMAEFLAELAPRTGVALDGGAGGRAEGVVFRSPDRGVIAKARFQDYERTLRRRGGAR